MPIQISISNAIKGEPSSGGGSSFLNQYSFEFDGSTDYVDCGSISALNSASTVSISMWCKKSSTSGVNISVGSLVSSTNGIWLQWFTDNTLYFTIRNGAIMTTSYALSGDTDWHNIIGVYNGVNAKIYVDGNLVVTGTNIPSSLSSTAGNNFEIGALDGSFFTSGNIDEVAIWNSELSATDATSIYNSGVPNDISSLSPVSWWRMGDAATYNGREWELVDQGSGGNNGFSVTLPAPPTAPSTDIPT